MASAPYTIPLYDADGFAARLVGLTPAQWSSNAAKTPGGTLYALMKSLGGNMAANESGLLYAQQSTYIQTATGAALDLAAQDFFGSAIFRQPGESDASLRARLMANLLLPAATTEALSAALTSLTGVVPRIILPWSPADTGAWGLFYWDVDTPVTPFRWTGVAPYQGFIETPLPTSNNIMGTNPVPCYDDGIYWDVAGSLLADLTFVGGGLDAVDATINAVKPEGVVAWVKIVPPFAPQTVSPLLFGTATVATGALSIRILMQTTGTIIVGLQASWPTNFWVTDVTMTGFTANFAVAAPAGASVDWMFVGWSLAPLPPPTATEIAAEGLSTTIPAEGTSLPFATPNWNTAVIGIDTSLVFSQQAPAGAQLMVIYEGSATSETASVAAGSLTWTVSAPTGTYFMGARANWNTEIGVTKQSGSAILTFNTPAPADAQVLAVWAT